MRPTDSHQQSSARPHLMSGNRKRAGGSTILDQLEPRTASARAAFGIDIEPRWLFAAAGAIALLVAVLSAIAWNNGPRTLAATPVQPAEKPLFEAGPARVERAGSEDAKAAETLLAQSEPVPLVVLPKEADASDTVKVTEAEAPPRVVVSPPPRPAAKPRLASKPPMARRSPIRQAARRTRSTPEPVQEAVPEPDPDVALISAIRRATEPSNQ